MGVVKPGLYVATVRNMANTLLWGPNLTGGWLPLIRDDGMAISAGFTASRKEVTDARPLVVLDPQDSRGVAIELAQAVCSAVGVMAGRDISAGIKAAQDVIARLAADEPDQPSGLGAVVRLASGHHAVRTCTCGGPDWRIDQAMDDATSRHWGSLDVVEVLHEGWSR